MDCHDIEFVEGLGAIRAFAHTIGDSILDAIVTKDVTASLESCVFEVFTTNGAQGKCLNYVSHRINCNEMDFHNLPSTFLLRPTGC